MTLKNMARTSEVFRFHVKEWGVRGEAEERGAVQEAAGGCTTPRRCWQGELLVDLREVFLTATEGPGKSEHYSKGTTLHLLGDNLLLQGPGIRGRPVRPPHL